MQVTRYATQGGVAVTREIREENYQPADNALARALDERRGVLVFVELRISRPLHALGYGVCRSAAGFDGARPAFCDRGAKPARPGLAAGGRRRACRIAGNAARSSRRATGSTARSLKATTRFSEEQRSRQPGVFGVARAGRAVRAARRTSISGSTAPSATTSSSSSSRCALRLPRPADQRDLVLYLPDEILIVDHMRQQAALHRYEFEFGGALDRRTCRAPPPPRPIGPTGRRQRRRRERPRPRRIRRAGRARQASVRPRRPIRGRARPAFRRRCADLPSVVFHRLRQANPAPYGALINLGDGEFLVSASPEMYVRVEGRRIETCPISGTIAPRRATRSRTPTRIRELLNSKKDESELTMCTDVDRNDKSRVCGRRAASRSSAGARSRLYSRLIHTVDHVEGELRAGIRRARRVSQPCLGGDRDRRAEILGDPLYRGGGALVAPLVWRRDRPGDLRRQHEHRADPAHDPHEGRYRRSARRRDIAVRQRSRRRGSRNPAEGLGAVRRDPRQSGAGCNAGRSLERKQVGAARCCWSTTRIRSSTRWPAISARPAPRSSTHAPRFARAAAAGGAVRPISSCCRRGRAGPPISR